MDETGQRRGRPTRDAGVTPASGPGGAPRRRMRAQDRRALVLEAAADTFAAQGYRGASMADIAAAAGVTAALLYRHFAGKAELFLACLEADLASLTARFDQAVAAEPAPDMWLQAITDAYISEGRSRLTSLWLNAAAEIERDAQLRVGLERSVLAVHRYVTDVIERSAAQPGGVRPDADPAAEAWIYLAQGLLLAIGIRGIPAVLADLPAMIGARRRWLYPHQYGGS